MLDVKDLSENLGIEIEEIEKAQKDEKVFKLSDLNPKKKHFFADDELESLKSNILKTIPQPEYEKIRQDGVESHVKKVAKEFADKYKVELPKTKNVYELLEFMHTNNSSSTDLKALQERYTTDLQAKETELQTLKRQNFETGIQNEFNSAISSVILDSDETENATKKALATSHFFFTHSIEVIDGQQVITNKITGKKVTDNSLNPLTIAQYLPIFLKTNKLIKAEIPAQRGGHQAKNPLAQQFNSIEEIAEYCTSKGISTMSEEARKLVQEFNKKQV